jgi:hypothetical protein
MIGSSKRPLPTQHAKTDIHIFGGIWTRHASNSTPKYALDFASQMLVNPSSPRQNYMLTIAHRSTCSQNCSLSITHACTCSLKRGIFESKPPKARYQSFETRKPAICTKRVCATEEFCDLYHTGAPQFNFWSYKSSQRHLTSFSKGL